MAAETLRASEAVAANLLRLRRVRRLSQEDVAERMSALGYGRKGKDGTRKWTRAATAESETGERQVTVDELIGLALILSVPIGELLDPGDATLTLGDVQLEGEPQGAALNPRRVKPFVRSDITLALTEASPVGFKLQTIPVEGRQREWMKAVGIEVNEDRKEQP